MKDFTVPIAKCALKIKMSLLKNHFFSFSFVKEQIEKAVKEQKGQKMKPEKWSNNKTG